jgi:hypothetical protein
LGTFFFEEHRAGMSQLGISQGQAKRLLEECGYKVAVLDGGSVEILTEFHTWRAQRLDSSKVGDGIERLAD